MSKLDELIRELCPEGVEYKKVSEITKVLRGKRLTKNQLSENGNFPVYHGGLEPLGYYDEYNRSGETIMIINVGASAGTIGYCNNNFWSSDGCYCLEPTTVCNTKFLFFLFQTREPFLISKVRKAGIPTLDAKVIERMSIPIPPLPVQEEVVRILDGFTQLTAELQEKLQAELQARKKQYEYYRDELLKPTSNTPMVRLGDFTTVTRGGNFQKKDFEDDGKYPCIHYGQMYTHFGAYTDKVIKYLNEDVYTTSKKAATNDIIMAVTSENVEDVCSCTAWIGQDNIAVSGHTAIIHHEQNPKYLSYYFRTSHFFKQKVKLAHGTKVIEVTPSSLLDCIIPLPSIGEQNRVVSTLDRLAALCESISSGLPAEIEARQKQYEHYRDKLLTFEERA